MNIIIGGLLVVTLMSRPMPIGIGYDEYELIRANNKVICFIRKESPLAKQVYTERINDTLASIEDNTRSITNLLMEKNESVAKVYQLMDTHARSRSLMTESQIDKFSDFVSSCKTHSGTLKDSLQSIDNRKGLELVKRELLHNDADYAFVYNELKSIESYQEKALESLDGILSAASDALSELA